MAEIATVLGSQCGILCYYGHANGDVMDGALCVVWHGSMTGVGTRLQDQMTMVGVAGDDWVTCTGHGRCDMLGNKIHRCMHESATGAEYRSAQEHSG